MDCLRDALHTNSAVCLSNLSTSVYLQMYVQCSFFRVSRHTNTQLECVIIAYSYWVACWHEEAAILEGGWGSTRKMSYLFICTQHWMSGELVDSVPFGSSNITQGYTRNRTAPIRRRPVQSSSNTGASFNKYVSIHTRIIVCVVPNQLLNIHTQEFAKYPFSSIKFVSWSQLLAPRGTWTDLASGWSAPPLIKWPHSGEKLGKTIPRTHKFQLEHE